MALKSSIVEVVPRIIPIPICLNYREYSVGFEVITVTENVPNAPGAFKRTTSGDFRLATAFVLFYWKGPCKFHVWRYIHILKYMSIYIHVSNVISIRPGFCVLQLSNISGGVFNIRPCTFQAGKEGPFFLDINSSVPYTVAKLQWHALLHFVYLYLLLQSILQWPLPEEIKQWSSVDCKTVTSSH